MDILKEIIANEVFPAIGCTEPISCTYAASAAAEKLGAPVKKLTLTVDAGTFKNGAAVAVPHTGGQKGNVIACALGAVIARPGLRLEILKDVDAKALEKARALVKKKAVSYNCRENAKGLYIEVLAEAGASRVLCVVSGGHTSITRLEKNGKSILENHPHAGSESKKYRESLKKKKLKSLIGEAAKPDKNTRAYINRGVRMNMDMTKKGIAIKRTAYQLEKMLKERVLARDLFYKVKLAVASAVDARMAGVARPVMTSGGSGNQGILAILVPYLVGTDRGVSKKRIEESIAVSHAVNSYVKCFVGELSVICGCAIAAGVASAVALVYQKAGIDMKKIAFAVDNVIGDLCGLICDGAKPGCSMKIVTAADTAMRSAFMALGGYGLSTDDGVLGVSPEESIRNLSKVSLEGMFRVDPAVVRILREKASPGGRA